MLGRRRSPSISRTRVPFWASTIAELTLVVVLPSSGSALVMRITFGGPPGNVRSSEVRNARYDSAICDRGRDFVTSATASLDEASASFAPPRISLLLLEPSGIIPNDGNEEIVSACSGVR